MLPFGVSLCCQMLLDHRHDNYASCFGIGINPKPAKIIKDTDVMLLVGIRFGKTSSSNYTLTKSS